MIHSTYYTGTATYTICNSNTTAKVPYRSNKTTYTTYTAYNTIRLQMLLTVLQLAQLTLQYNTITYSTYDTNTYTTYNIIRLLMLLTDNYKYNFAFRSRRICLNIRINSI